MFTRLRRHNRDELQRFAVNVAYFLVLGLPVVVVELVGYGWGAGALATVAVLSSALLAARIPSPREKEADRIIAEQRELLADMKVWRTRLGQVLPRSFDTLVGPMRTPK